MSIMFTIEFDHLTDFFNFTVNEDKLKNESIFKISAKARRQYVILFKT